MKTRGAVEVLCFAFAADVDTAAVLPTLRRLVDDGLIRINDLTLLTRTPGGGDDVAGAWTPLPANDLRLIAGSPGPGPHRSSAGIVDHLVALAQLHLDGVLTLSEVMTAKRRVVK
ncbi:hypothetical protein OWR29_08345 [Actinoplanes sp. Pm04-4]|uniref:Uncharacterized protein n=1 Tax=Paractinoplanes pyxinae TaxID=2997416 RepID=A0ABT4AUU2_9ACTN|nr:hypothetical protein [Actinoplanes pyxinae]MCY1138003.1 hypothetical protein [Actinoplanes pyxinae]